MTRIPVNPADLPTERTPWPDNITYKGVIKEVTLATKTDKNGNQYVGLKVEVMEPEEFRKKTIGDNYIQLPGEITPDMDAKARAAVMEGGVRLGRLCASAKLKPSPDGFDTDDLLGEMVEFTVKNEPYNGAMIPKINDYMI
jgi:hypothetical protein